MRISNDPQAVNYELEYRTLIEASEKTSILIKQLEEYNPQAAPLELLDFAQKLTLIIGVLTDLIIYLNEK